MSLHDDLVAAKALIADPDDWCQGRFNDGERYCIRGACAVAENAKWFGADTRSGAALMEAAGFVTYAALARFNDHRDTTHSDVMALFDRAIAASLNS